MNPNQLTTVRKQFWLLLLLCAPLVSVAAPLELQVSADGSSLKSALARVSQLSSGDWPAEGVVIQFAPGKYRLDSTIRIGPDSSGRVGAPLVLRGPASGVAVLTGAKALQDWKQVSDPGILARLDPSARGKVLQASVEGREIGSFDSMDRQGRARNPSPVPSELFFKGRPMHVAEWPNRGFAQIAAVGPSKDAITLRDGHFESWAKETDLWMTGYWAKDWADEWIPVAGVKVAEKELRMRGGPPELGAIPGQRVRIINALSELDSPGEWYLDKRTKTIYFWPPEPITGEDAEISVLGTPLISVEGASHVRIQALGFQGTRSDAISVEGGRDVRVERSRIRNVGVRGVKMRGIAHAVIGCDIFDVGEGGIEMEGGDRQTLSAGELVAQGNRIARFNRWVRTYRPAIYLRGVGNIARSNLIYDAPHMGIIFLGNNHLIEFNELHDLATETGDVGAIYSSRDWTGRGTFVRNNYLHDIRGFGRIGSNGVYLDDQTSGTTVSGNLFVRVNHPVFVGGGRDNLIDNNLFIQSSPAIHLDARGRSWQRAITDDPEGGFQRALRKVPYQRPPYTDQYPTLANILKDSPGSPLGNVARRIGVIGSVPLELQEQTDKLLTVDRIFSDNQFRFVRGTLDSQRSAAEDFQLDSASPAVREGFAPLALDRMGCPAKYWHAVDTTPDGEKKLPLCQVQ